MKGMLWDFEGREGVTGSSIMMGAASSAAVGSSDIRRAVMEAGEAAMGLLGAKALVVPARAEMAMAKESFMVLVR